MQFMGNVHCGGPVISTKLFHSQSLEMHAYLALDQLRSWKTSTLDGAFQRKHYLSVKALNWQTIAVFACDLPA